jgi:hypothetical protein
MREFGDNQYNVFDNGRYGRDDRRSTGGLNHFLDIAQRDDQRLSDSRGRIDLYGNYFRGLRGSDGHGQDHGNGIQYANADFCCNDDNADGMREFGNRQYRVLDNGRHGRDDRRIAGGNNHFLDIAQCDDQRFSDGYRRVDLYGNYFRRMRGSDSYWIYHGNGQ